LTTIIDMKRLPFSEGDPHRPRVEIEHRFGIEGVTIGTHAGIFERQVAKNDELAKCAPFDEESEVHVGLGAIEIVGRDWDTA
jgi:hypothetical protein